MPLRRTEGRDTRAGETLVHLERTQFSPGSLANSGVAAAEVIEVQAFGVERVGDGSAEHGIMLPPADRLLQAHAMSGR